MCVYVCVCVCVYVCVCAPRVNNYTMLTAVMVTQITTTLYIYRTQSSGRTGYLATWLPMHNFKISMVEFM